jgi:hypothetical protein
MTKGSENRHAENPVVLVACCGPKLKEPVPAADLYISDLFKKARTYAERRGRWFILSALHGLLDPSAVVAPYDVTLKKMPAAKRREWVGRCGTRWKLPGWLGCRWSHLPGRIM